MDDAALHGTLDRLVEESPGGAELLSLLAFFAPAPVPAGVVLDHLDLLPASLADSVREPKALESLSELAAGEILELGPDTLFLLADAGVAIRGRLDAPQRRNWCALALQVLSASFPAEPDECTSWGECEVLLPHVLALADHAEELEISEQSLWLMDRSAVFLHSRGEVARAYELATRVMTAAGSLPSSDPLKGTIHHTFGRLLAEHGELAAARRELELALAIHRSLGPEHPSPREDLVSLADLLLELGEGDEARAVLAPALSDGGDREPDRWSCSAQRMLGWILCDQGKLEEALVEYEQALELTERVMGAEHPHTANARVGLGVVLGALNRLDEAKAELEQALEIIEPALGPEHPEVAAIHSNLGGVLLALKRPHDALVHLETALEAGKAQLPDDHRGLWIRHRKLASVLRGLGDLGAARTHAEEALGISERAMGPEDARVEGDLSTLASILEELQDLAGARDAYRRARAIAEREHGATATQVAEYDVRLGRILRGLGELAASRGHLEQALEIYEGTPDGDSRALAIRLGLAALMGELGDQLVVTAESLGADAQAPRLREQVVEAFAEVLEGELETKDVTAIVAVADASMERIPQFAATALERAEAILEEENPESSSTSTLAIAASWHRLGRMHRGRLEFEQAGNAFDAALKRFASDPLSVGITLHDIAELREEQERPEEALELYREAAQRKREGDDLRGVAVTQQAIGRALERSKDYDAALAAYEEQWEMVRSLPERDPKVEGITLHDMADVQRLRGEADEATRLYREALEHKREAGDAVTASERGVTLSRLGRILVAGRDFEGALAAFGEWLGILRALSKPDPQAEGVVLHDIAAIRQTQGELDDAAELYREAGERKRAALGGEGIDKESGGGGSLNDLAITMQSLGRALVRLGDHDAALAAYEEQLDLLRSIADLDPQAEGIALHDVADAQAARGETAKAIGLYREAIERKREALARQRQAGRPADARSLATTAQSLGRALEKSGDHEAALAAYKDELEAVRSLPQPDPRLEGVALHDIADVLLAQGELGEAIELYGQAVERKRVSGDGNQRDLGVTLQSLGRALGKNGDYDAALAAYEEQLEILRSLPEPNIHIEGVALHDIADTRKARGESSEAIELYRAALERKREAWRQGDEAGQPVDPRSLIATLRAYAGALVRSADYAAALAAYEEQLEIVRSLPDPDPQIEGVALHDIAEVNRAMGRLQEAVGFYREAAARKREAKDSPRASLVTVLIAQCTAELALGRDIRAAEAVGAEAIELLHAEAEPDPRLLAAALVVRGQAARELNEPERALALFHEAAEEMRKSPVADPLELISIEARLGDTHEALGQAAEAAAARATAVEGLTEAVSTQLESLDDAGLYEVYVLCLDCGARDLAEEVIREMRSRVKKRGGAAHSVLQLAYMLGGLGRMCETDVKDYDAALAAYEEQLDLLRSLPDTDPQLEGVALHDIGDVRGAKHEVDRAVDSYREAVERKRTGDEDPRDLGVTLQRLGRSLERNGDYDAALAAYEEQLEIVRSLPDPDPQIEGTILHDLADVRRAQEDPKAAIELYREAVERKQAGDSVNPGDLARSWVGLGSALVGEREFAAGRQAGGEALTLLRDLDDPPLDLVVSALELRADAAREDGDLEGAIGLLREADDMLRDPDPSYLVDAERVKSLLADLLEKVGRDQEAKAAREQAEALGKRRRES